MFKWLSRLFPPRLPVLHPVELKKSMGYYNRLERSKGEQPSHDKGRAEGVRIERKLEGEYIPAEPTELHYPEKQQVRKSIFRQFTLILQK
jgi:hypothetical protein